MTMPRPLGGNRGEDEARQKAIEELFPLDDQDSKLAMVARTPRVMVMPMTRMRMIARTMDFVTQVWRRWNENPDDPLLKDFITPEELEEIGMDTYIAEGAKNLNLIKVFIQEFDVRMIGANGDGRSDMKEIFGQFVMKSEEAKRSATLDGTV